MTVRTTTKNVTFRHPFSIRGVDDVQPPGTYAIETAEEQNEQGNRDDALNGEWQAFPDCLPHSIRFPLGEAIVARLRKRPGHPRR